MTSKISLELGERSYDILIQESAINGLKDFLAQNNYSKIFVITDENVAQHHLDDLKLCLSNNDLQTIITKAGEQTKSFTYLEKISEEILAKGVDRKSLIIAFGGGVIGDLSGFIASILLRGIDFVQVPTTLLSAVDSSVGGKTAINSKAGKNLIGAFYQPKLVVCDLNFLKTLPEREFKAGYAEIVKYGFIYDEEFFEFLEENHQKIFAKDTNILERIISRSCEIKAEIVARDEREVGERALLNFGHTFGHIFETETNYSNELNHGEAVALGMMMAAKMSQNFAMISENEVAKIKNHLEKCGFTIDPKELRSSWNEKNLVSHLFKDKKVENQNLTFILLEKIGKAIVKKGVALDEFDKVLQDFI